MPAHKGISGNEAADRQAKRSAGNDTSVRVRLPERDRLLLLEEMVSMKFQERLMLTATLNNVGRFAYGIKSEICRWEHANHQSRVFETVAAKLRMGHVMLNSYAFRYQLRDSPLCICDVVETVEHFLLHCRIYNRQRNNMMQQLRLQNLNQVCNLKTFWVEVIKTVKHKKDNVVLT